MQRGPHARPARWWRGRVAVVCTLVTLLMIGTSLGGIGSLARALTPLPPRDPDRSVYDVAGVIDGAHETRMQAVHAELFRKTGVAIVTVTVPALVEETIADFAVRVGTEWGAGRRREDRGVVVAFARDDREIYIATGYGVEGYLPDGKVGAILDQHVLPHLRRDDFSTGLYQASMALVAASAEEYGVTISDLETPRPAPAPESSTGWTTLEWIVRGGLGLLFLYVLVRHPRLLLFWFLGNALRRGRGSGGFGGGSGSGGFGGGGFGGGGAGRRF
jgi:uncharacterized protein